MARRARSARGEIVDFDLLAIKQQIADAKSNRIEVASVSKFVDHRPVEIETAVVLPAQTSAAEFEEDRNWEVPENAIVDSTQDAETAGALDEATKLVKGKK
jgi:hypothetical protein